MSDGSLSQDEIDALLQGADDLTSDSLMNESGVSAAAAAPAGGISDSDKIAFNEILSIEAESFSTTLSTIISKKVTFSNPDMSEQTPDSLRQKFAHDYVNVRLDFNDGIIGDNLFLMKKSDASVIASLMMNQGEDSQPAEFDELYQSAFTEAISQINGATITNLTNKFNKNIRMAPPKTGVVTDSGSLLLPGTDKLVEVTFSLNIDGNPQGVFHQIMSLSLVKDLIGLSTGGAPAGGGMGGFAPQQAASPAADLGFAMPQQTQAAAQQPAVQIQQAELPSLAQQAGIPPEQASNISLLLDVPMQMTVELGRTRMLIKDILGLGEGSIIELDKLAGEPVDILVNNKLVAKGEVVVIDENFGVRVTDIISPMDRINNLQ